MKIEENVFELKRPFGAMPNHPYLAQKFSIATVRKLFKHNYNLDVIKNSSDRGYYIGTFYQKPLATYRLIDEGGRVVMPRVHLYELGEHLVNEGYIERAKV